MSKLHWQPGTMLYPVPAVLVSCGTVEEPNVLTVAWTGIVCSNPPRTYISIRPERFSHDLIEKSGEFVINLPTKALVRALDLCGVKSGRDGDKLALAKLTAEECPGVSAPAIAECPLSLPCRVFDVQHLGSHDMFLADILSVEVEESLLDAKGKLRLEKAGLLTYAHGTYYGLGKSLGTFGYSVRKKQTRKPKPKK